MNPKSKQTRERLKMATRAEFEHLVYEAMLTPWCEKILRLHIGEGVSEGGGYSERSYRRMRSHDGSYGSHDGSYEGGMNSRDRYFNPSRDSSRDGS